MTARMPRSGYGFSTADFTSPLTVPGGEVAGAEIVRELPQPMALPVWQTLRSLLLWAAEVPAHRGELFEPRAMEQWERELLEGTFDADLRYPLAVIVGELARPGAAQPEPMARACLCVTEWGLAHNAVRTALGFIEAAALCWPEHPRYAWMAGRLLRTHGFLREAEQWIKRAIRVAGSLGDWETQTLGLNSLGNVLYDLGSYREAQRSQLTALRLVRKRMAGGDLEGEVLHDLFVATAYVGELDKAEEYARAALERYSPQHHRLLHLAYDVAFLWIKRGHFSRALPVLTELAERFDEPHERVLVFATAARAAGACGQEAVYRTYAAEASKLAGEIQTGRGVPYALYELGLGASSLGHWEPAEQFLTRAQAAARARSEMDVVAKAGNALTTVRDRRSAEETIAVACPRNRGERETLSSRFVTSLRGVPVVAGFG